MGPNQNHSLSAEEIQQLKQWDKKHVWHPFTQMQDYDQFPPLIISHAEGVYLYDIEGNQYLDGNSSLWVNLHGHNRAEINQAIANQMLQISHSTMLGQGNVPATKLAKRLVDMTPPGLEKVFYSDNGSTANEVALKMAFQYWHQIDPPRPERNKFLSIKNAYHGDTIGSVSLGGIGLFHSIFGPLLFERHMVPYPVYSKYTSTKSFADIAQESLDECERILKEHSHEITAAIVEPMMQGAAGILTQAPGFLKGLRELCDTYEILLICDEVATGFGRTGKMFACEHEGVTPDLMALAKGISGGYLPLAATLTTNQVYEGFLGEYSEFKTFFHGHSYTGNQLGSASALASLDLFEKDNTLENIQPLIAHMERRLDRLFEECDRVEDIRQVGMAAGVDVCKSRKNQEAYSIEQQAATKYCFNMRKHGIWLRPLGNTIVLMPPLVCTTEHIDHLIFGIEEVLKEEIE